MTWPSPSATARTAHDRAADARLPYCTQCDQRLDVYALPQARDRPIVIFWYGGGWTNGEKAQYRFIGTALAEHGYIAVVPDYRKYPAVQFPSFVEDGARALVWVYQHAREIGGDPSTDRTHGPFGRRAPGRHARLRAPLRACGRRAPRCGFAASSASPASTRRSRRPTPCGSIIPPLFRSNDWQPLWHVDRHAPPSLLLHGLEDRLVNPVETMRLRNALVRHGVHVEMELYSGRSHADTVAAFSPLARRRDARPQERGAIHRIARLLKPATGSGRSAARTKSGRRWS